MKSYFLTDEQEHDRLSFLRRYNYKHAYRVFKKMKRGLQIGGVIEVISSFPLSRYRNYKDFEVMSCIQIF